MAEIIGLLKDINIAQLLAILVGMWFFYRRLDQKIENVTVELRRVETSLKTEIHGIREDNKDTNKRIDTLYPYINFKPEYRKAE